MLAEQERAGAADPDLRRELDSIRDETGREMRSFVKKRVGKLEKRVEKRVGKLERRLDEVERERQHAEWRIHNSTEQMLDGLLREVRAIADLLTRIR